MGPVQQLGYPTTGNREVGKKLLFTYREAAQMMSISERSLWSLVASRELGSIRLGRSVRIPLSAIEELIAKRLEN